MKKKVWTKRAFAIMLAVMMVLMAMGGCKKDVPAEPVPEPEPAPVVEEITAPEAATDLALTETLTDEDGALPAVHAAWTASEGADGYEVAIAVTTLEDEAVADEATEEAEPAAEIEAVAETEGDVTDTEEEVVEEAVEPEVIDTAEAEYDFIGLEYGTTYTVTVIAYTNDEDGEKLYSEAATSEVTTQTPPIKYTVSITKQAKGDKVYVGSADPLTLRVQVLDGETPIEGAEVVFEWFYGDGSPAKEGEAANKTLADGVTYESTYTTPKFTEEGTFDYYATISVTGAESVKADVVTVTVVKAPARNTGGGNAGGAGNGGGAAVDNGGGNAGGGNVANTIWYYFAECGAQFGSEGEAFAHCASSGERYGGYMATNPGDAYAGLCAKYGWNPAGWQNYHAGISNGGSGPSTDEELRNKGDQYR